MGREVLEVSRSDTAPDAVKTDLQSPGEGLIGYRGDGTAHKSQRGFKARTCSCACMERKSHVGNQLGASWRMEIPFYKRHAASVLIAT